MSIAFPFVDVEVDTSGLAPVMRRAPGVLAVVGVSTLGDAPANTPRVVGSLEEAASMFATVDGNGTITASSPLYEGLVAAMTQSPGPSKIYGVKAAADGIPAALASLNAADDVTFVTLAGVVASAPPDAGTSATTQNPDVAALFAHVQAAATGGDKRMAVFALDPTLATEGAGAYATAADSALVDFRSSRSIAIAARGAVSGGGTAQIACAAAAAIAGQPPASSMVLKRLSGFQIPLEEQYSPSEIKAIAGVDIIPIIDPALIAGPSLHFAEGRTYTDDPNLAYIDVVRLLDDVEYRLKAGLINMIGDARITKAGLISVVTRARGILGRLLGPGGIDAFEIRVPVLEILRTPRGSWTAPQTNLVTEARSNREVQMMVNIVLGPAIHLLKINLAPTYT